MQCASLHAGLICCVRKLQKKIIYNVVRGGQYYKQFMTVVCGRRILIHIETGTMHGNVHVVATAVYCAIA